MKDTGTATVDVTMTSPTLPAAVAVDTAPPTGVTVERFYGLFSDTTGTFGLTARGDTVIVAASELHFFTGTTRVEFPNGALAFVDSVKADTLIFLVPAGADTGQLVMRNLVDDLGNPRDSVLTRIVFNGPGSAALDDFFEPSGNDTMPLDSTLLVSYPFQALLSYDHTKTSPADSNFLWFTVSDAPNDTLDIVADWQVDADVDFKICNAVGDPPTGYDPVLCPRPIGNNSTNLRREEELGLILSVNRYVIGFYCKSSCPASLPLTYRVTITEQ